MRLRTKQLTFFLALVVITPLVLLTAALTSALVYFKFLFTTNPVPVMGGFFLLTTYLYAVIIVHLGDKLGVFEKDSHQNL